MAGPRVRFAPSPTGYFHVGSARTALYNWLFARRSRGTFILRIEDTDEARNAPEWVDGILSAMAWLGLDWDEGPYFQSDNAAHHRQAAERLHAAGLAYYCDCTRDQVQDRTKARGVPGYDGYCAGRGLGPGPGRALRFRVPDEGQIVVDDVVRGKVTFEKASIEDFVILKSDGQPLFHLANVVDDIDMRVSHVIRAEEHLPNTPKAIMLWSALCDREPPVFAHLPVLVNERRQKLSKRRDPVAVEGYRDQGFLAEAMRNYLVLLGWSPMDREVLSLDEMVVEFRLEDVNNSPAFFDVTKLRHFNGEYIRAMPTARFVDACQPWLEKGPWPAERYDPDAFVRMAPLVQERVTVLGEVPDWVDFLFLDRPVTDPSAWERVSGAAGAADILRQASAGLATCPWDAGSIRTVIEEAGAAAGLKLAKAQAPVRVAVTGRTVGPPLFESIEVLGRDRTRSRLEEALSRLGAEPDR
ncbi:MAG TPA: glutamate--tRNA ligase [Acidimicrobiales bacterium]|nr:glutamate--tRNA ligase [Acidimicrobiales bacterium]